MYASSATYCSLQLHHSLHANHVSLDIPFQAQPASRWWQHQQYCGCRLRLVEYLGLNFCFVIVSKITRGTYMQQNQKLITSCPWRLYKQASPWVLLFFDCALNVFGCS